MTHRRSDEVAWDPAPQEHFTGEVWFGPLSDEPADPSDMNVLGVTFSPGARTDWHSHPAGQVLYVVSGTARVQSEGESTVVAGPGDSVQTPAGVLHWHGAADDAPMTHLSITHGGPTEWSDRKVTDEEYSS